MLIVRVIACVIPVGSGCTGNLFTVVIISAVGYWLHDTIFLIPLVNEQDAIPSGKVEKTSLRLN